MSWEQLLSIFQTARDEAEQNAAAVPVACPNDGEPLREGPNGVLFCIADGWRWNGVSPDVH